MLTSTTNRGRSSIPRSTFRVPHFRKAFTLVELLVVIAIIVALAAIVLLFLPKREVRLAAQGAEQLQTYIASAKSRALRDQAPRGVRLLPSPLGGFREFQYIEVPEPYAPMATAIVKRWGNNPDPDWGKWVYIQFDITGAVQPGDFFEITTGSDNSPHRIDAVSSNPPNPPQGGGPYWGIHLLTPPNIAQSRIWVDTQNYRFVRQPRPLLGEPTLQLPDKVLVNGGLSLNVPQAYDFTTSGNYDILFAPSGAVINATGGRVVLWVEDDNLVSQPTLLCVYSYTGGVAAHPVSQPFNRGQPISATNNPYQFTQDGKSSGQ
jgi:prepilin-type N-terminal cleavage/methylation domain-containing protein